MPLSTSEQGFPISLLRAKANVELNCCRVVQTYPDLDCVFLNSGTQSQAKLTRPEEVDLDAFHREFDVNYTSVVNLTIKFLPHLQKKDYPTGLIITGSLLALVPAFVLPAYSASKAALRSFFDSLRQQNKGFSKVKFIELLPPAVQCKRFTSPSHSPVPVLNDGQN